MTLEGRVRVQLGPGLPAGPVQAELPGGPSPTARGGTEAASAGTRENRTVLGCLARGSRHSPAVQIAQISRFSETGAAIRPLGA